MKIEVLKDIKREILSLTDITEATQHRALAIITELYTNGDLDSVNTLTTEDSSLILEIIFTNGHVYTMIIEEDSKLLDLLLALDREMKRYVL